VELRDYLNIMYVRRWVIIQAVLVVTVAALAVSLVQTRTYMGEAKILITEQDVGAAIFGSSTGNIGDSVRGLDTQVQLVQLLPMAELAVKSANLRISPSALLENVSVSAIGQTNVITLTAFDGSASRAASYANALADAYVKWSMDSKRESIKAAADEVQTRLDEAKAEVLALSKQIQASGGSQGLSAELEIATGTYTRLAQKLEELRVNEQLELGSGRVVSRATPSPDPVSPKPVKNAILGLIVGIVLGLGLAFLMEYLDNSIKSTADAEAAYGAPVLGHIPAERTAKGEKRQRSIVLRPGGAAAEAYRVLRNNLNFVNFQHDIKTLLITSSAPGEGKSTVAANLATALVQAGATVALVNCDFRRPVTDEFFEVNNMIGLSDVLLGRSALGASLQLAEENLSILNSGSMPPNPSELLGSEKMAAVIKSLGKMFDWVIVDSPPLLVAADSSALVRWADAVLVVARGGVSTRPAAKTGREMLDKVGARTIGVVLWGLRSGPDGGYGQYGSYAYHPDEPGATGTGK
jgi:capsular exopolysaccharide synthesis family protein